MDLKELYSKIENINEQVRIVIDELMLSFSCKGEESYRGINLDLCIFHDDFMYKGNINLTINDINISDDELVLNINQIINHLINKVNNKEKIWKRIEHCFYDENDKIFAYGTIKKRVKIYYYYKNKGDKKVNLYKVLDLIIFIIYIMFICSWKLISIFDDKIFNTISKVVILFLLGFINYRLFYRAYYSKEKIE